MRANRALNPRSQMPESDGGAPLRVEIVATADCCSAVVALAGEVDMDTGDLFKHRLAEASGLAERVVVDLREVTFMDSTGMNILLVAFGKNPDALVIRSPSPAVAKLLTITGLDQLFNIDTANEPR